MKTPTGFAFSGVHAGIKPSRKDVALICSDRDCAAAACTTVNKARAAPVVDVACRLPAEGIRAVVINSGNANALTGASGAEDVEAVKIAAGRALGIPADAVLTASTGVIGVRLPAPKIVGALPRLVQELSPEPTPAAEAIMTTDTRVKMAFRRLEIGGRVVTVSALCKGSGMIAPQLATMIAVVVTDAAIRPGPLAAALQAAVASSFNCLTVDNDMSTNDVVVALANGSAGNPPICDPGPDFDRLAAALAEICEELAREIAADGEGATKMVEVAVSGAPDKGTAEDLARSIAGSSLVKAALFGADPNWGRILATVGARAGSQAYAVEPSGARVSIQGMTVYDGAPTPHEVALLKSKMRGPEVKVSVELSPGLDDPSGSAVAWGCDLSYDYVKINADYTSLIVQTPDGGVAKDDRLTHYSPAFKVSLLVEALSYITRFAGKCCVVRYGGAAMVKESLKRSFCNDINLLRSVGLRPIVVHGGGPDVARTLEKLGRKSEREDGARVTDAGDLKVLEMVQTGAINTELVTLLNQDGANAVGVSGKDGGLLRAKGRADRSEEVISVNHKFLEMLLRQHYVPVISPMGIGDDGQSIDLSADAVAAEVAIATKAHKLIYLADVAGILERGELVTELKASELEARLGGELSGRMRTTVQSIARALAGGVERVHVIDGRTPHSLIAELFTDRGVGTLVTC
jgi:acetylglutamate kinase